MYHKLEVELTRGAKLVLDMLVKADIGPKTPEEALRWLVRQLKESCEMEAEKSRSKKTEDIGRPGRRVQREWDDILRRSPSLSISLK